ncbi:MAG: pyridoxal-phosphate dependent enzyme, partial [Tabrizicola sp.]
FGDTAEATTSGAGLDYETSLTVATNVQNEKRAKELKDYRSRQAEDAYRSFKAGHIIADAAPKTIADGLLVPLKDLTWHFVSNHVSEIYTASEDEIVDAMKLTWKHLRVVMEPSSAVPLAVVLKNRAAFRGKRVGIIITGGNVDLDKLPWMKG